MLNTYEILLVKLGDDEVNSTRRGLFFMSLRAISKKLRGNLFIFYRLPRKIIDFARNDGVKLGDAEINSA